MKLESITNFLLAVGAVMTACTGMYREYNSSKKGEDKVEIPSPEKIISDTKKFND